jgi:hypothetical protein
MAWPQLLRINAYPGDGQGAAWGPVPAEARRWPLRHTPPKVSPFLKPAPPVDPRQWQHETVGWGIVAVEPSGFSPEALAAGADLPEPIRQLRQDRGNAPIFRFRPGWDQRYRLLRNYQAQKDLAIGQSPAGTGSESIPRYLLIYGDPGQVPWELQYVLNAHYSVGRIHLTGEALENYIAALRSGWKDSVADRKAAVIWAVDQGGDDITALMRDLVAEKVYSELSADSDLQAGAQFLDGPGNATAGKLIAALASAKPGLVVSTSHGQTYPLDNLDTLGRSLGLLVDQDYASAGIDSILSSWNPDGAIWYAHACCSAGSAAETLFSGLTDPGSGVDRVLNGVAQLGNRVAPMPSALLGCKRPLRAFIGHVEPTFDWTLLNPDTNQALTDSVQQALYTELYQPSPVGYAFRRCYDRLAPLFASYDEDQRAFSRGGNTRDAMLKDILCARDVQSMVILGDPTVALPAL